MKTILLALAALTGLTACVAPSLSQAQPPNYVTSQFTAAPAIRNDSYGGAAMTMRGLPQ